MVYGYFYTPEWLVRDLLPCFLMSLNEAIVHRPQVCVKVVLAARNTEVPDIVGEGEGILM